MFKDLFKNYIYPIVVFSGGMIGVGFLSLPYIAMKAGIWIVFLYFLVVTFLVIAINSIFCQISLKTPDYKRFPGFVGYYLGKWAKVISFFSIILGTVGVLLVYLLVAGEFLTALFAPFFGGNIITHIIIYFFIVSIIIYFDIKVVSKVQFGVIAALLLFIFLIFIEGFSQIKVSNIFSINWKMGLANFFLPYGSLLFALWGVGLIPEVEEMLGKQKKRLKSVIIISTIAVSIFYLLFTILILGITGNYTNQTALSGLTGFLPNVLVLVSLFIGVLVTFVAFVSQGIVFKKTLMFDLKIKHWQAFVMTCCPPLILFLIGFKDFIPLISIIGGVSLGINGILILLMYKKIGGKNIIIYPLSLVFLLGVIYEIIYFIK
ncbi:MAG: aromatic amino acid transport family protein [Candidatus Staskawiczbacteria bacterium]